MLPVFFERRKGKSAEKSLLRKKNSFALSKKSKTTSVPKPGTTNCSQTGHADHMNFQKDSVSRLSNAKHFSSFRPSFWIFSDRIISETSGTSWGLDLILHFLIDYDWLHSFAQTFWFTHMHHPIVSSFSQFRLSIAYYVLVLLVLLNCFDSAVLFCTGLISLFWCFGYIIRLA